METLHLIDLARRKVRHYGRDRLGDRHIHALCQAVSLVVMSSSLGGETCVRFTIDGEHVLIIDEGLPFAARRFLVLREIGIWLGGGARGSASDVFAMVGVVNHRQCISHGPRWVSARFDAVGHLVRDGGEVQPATVAVLLDLAGTTPNAACGAHSAKLAYALGRIARARARHDRAEVWLRYGYSTARRDGDFETAANCLLSLGRTFRQRGNYPQSRRFFTLAAAKARRWRVSSTLGSALHSLMVFAAERGDFGSVSVLAQRAMDAYGAGHEHLPALACDLALAWLDAGRGPTALPILLRLRDFTAGMYAAAPLLISGSIARAAAAAGDVELYRDATADCSAYASRSKTGEDVAEALVDVATAAIAMEDWKRAAAAAELALETATSRGECRWAFRAEELLATIREQTRRVLPVAEASPAETHLALRMMTALSSHPAPA